MTAKEKAFLTEFMETFKKLSDSEKQRLLDIGTGMIAMKEKINENKETDSAS